MSNATTAAAQSLLDAAQAEATNHDQWVAFWVNPAHITAFVASRLNAKLAAEARHDSLAAEVLASDIVSLTRLQAMDAATLADREADWAAEDGWNAVEGKWEMYYYYSAQEDLAHAAALAEFRAHEAAVAAWSAAPAEAHLTHTPFAALAV